MNRVTYRILLIFLMTLALPYVNISIEIPDLNATTLNEVLAKFDANPSHESPLVTIEVDEESKANLERLKVQLSETFTAKAPASNSTQENASDNANQNSPQNSPIQMAALNEEEVSPLAVPPSSIELIEQIGISISEENNKDLPWRASPHPESFGTAFYKSAGEEANSEFPEELAALDTGDAKRTEVEYKMPQQGEPRITAGQKLLDEFSALLADLEYEFSVDREVVMGIWGIETNYGRNFGKPGVAHELVKYGISRPDRKPFVMDQLRALDRLAKLGYVDPKTTPSSFAGAMGHTQFIPTSYEKFGVDWDGNGKVDLWNAQDALASTANYLHEHGWTYGQPWGFEVKVPSGFFDRSGTRKRQSLSFWKENGVTPAHDDVNMPDDGHARVERYKGKNYLLFDNFFVIMTYNASRDYAFSVSALGDMVVNPDLMSSQIVSTNVNAPDNGDNLRAIDAPGGNSSGGRNKASNSCGSEICRIQKALKKKGFYSGAIDGSNGPQLQRAIAKFQLQSGMPVDGKVTKMLSARLK